MKQLVRSVSLILLLILVFITSLKPGTTGKIAGTITDEKSGEPLPGANIVVIGTTLGSTTDLNGEYIILQVPPGTYELQVSFIGYQKVLVNDVRVFIDQTARIDVALKEETIQVDEVVITAERTTIRPDVSTSVSAVSDEEIEKLPINSVVSAIGLQAGIRGGWSSFTDGAKQPTFVSDSRSYTRGKVSVQGGLNIRGGEGDNILFEMDGVTLRDPRNNEPITKVPLSSVKEISVERGGFQAEYGQVRSGIVNVVTREGDRQSYSGNIQVRYSPPAPKYWRGEGILDVLDPYSFALRPYFDDDVCWTGTTNGVWDEYMRAQYPEFRGWNEVSRILNSDNDPTNDLTPQGAQRVFMYETRKRQINDEPDFEIDAGFGGPVPFISDMLGNLRFYTSYRSNREMLLFPLTRPDYRDFDWTMQVTSNIAQAMTLRLSSLIGKQYTIRHNWDATSVYYYPHFPNEVADVASGINSEFDLIALFSDYNFSLSDIGHQSYSAKLTHTFSPATFYEVSVEHFRRDYNTRPTALRDTSVKYEVIPGFFEDSNPYGYWPTEVTGALIKGGSHVSKARDFTKVNSTTIKADFTSQLNFQNLVKAGIEFNYNDLDFDYGIINSGSQGVNLEDPDAGYSSRVRMDVFPVRASIYIQDKLELEEFTLNAGLRLDYSDSRADWWSVNAFDQLFFLENADGSIDYNDRDLFPVKESESQWQLSPRLGISHPITENSKLFFNYGHFKQVPQYESLFRVERNLTRQLTSLGNPNLILAKTISYELGYDHILFEDYLLQIAAFYNDITDQQDFTRYQSRATGLNYTLSTSNNYEDIRGFEITLRKNTGLWWSGFINYTYQVRTTGHFGSPQIFASKQQQNEFDQQTVNLYQDRPIPQPYARANINFYTPQDFGPILLNHNILGGFGLNITADWQAGYWTTWNPNQLPSIAYNVQARDFFNVALRLDKTINIGKFRIQLFMDMDNALNTLRLWNTDDQAYLESLHLPKSEAYTNIPGDDKVGDYREPGVEYQPVRGVEVWDVSHPPAADHAWYKEISTGVYREYVSGQWVEVDKNRVDKMLDDKAYIDMPNASTFWFLNPRRIFFGLRFSFNLGD
jgi:outer membrane receptor protein involved in Fe transport